MKCIFNYKAQKSWFLSHFWLQRAEIIVLFEGACGATAWSPINRFKFGFTVTTKIEGFFFYFVGFFCERKERIHPYLKTKHPLWVLFFPSSSQGRQREYLSTFLNIPHSKQTQPWGAHPAWGEEMSAVRNPWKLSSLTFPVGILGEPLEGGATAEFQNFPWVPKGQLGQEPCSVFPMNLQGCVGSILS